MSGCQNSGIVGKSECACKHQKISFTLLSASSQGVTFRVEKDDLVIARILHGGMIDRQGLLHVGDIIKEVNGKDVGNNPTELQEMLKDCSGGITLKILPSYRDAPAPPQVNSTSDVTFM